MRKWTTISGLGDVYIEKELIKLDYPLLFIVAIKNKRYMVCCLDDEDGLFLMAKVTYNKILKILTGSLDLRKVITETNELFWVSYDFTENEYVAEKVDPKFVDDEDLPDEGTFFTVHNSSIDEYRYTVALYLCIESIERQRAKYESDTFVSRMNISIRNSEEKEITTVSYGTLPDFKRGTDIKISNNAWMADRLRTEQMNRYMLA